MWLNRKNISDNKQDEKLLSVDTKFGKVLLYALQYSLGRRTYITETTSSYISSVLKFLPQASIDELKTYMETYTERVNKGVSSFGDSCDKASWDRLASVLATAKETGLKSSLSVAESNTALMLIVALRYVRDRDGRKLRGLIKYITPYIPSFTERDLFVFYQDATDRYYFTKHYPCEIQFVKDILMELAKRGQVIPSHLPFMGEIVASVINVSVEQVFFVSDEFVSSHNLYFNLFMIGQKDLYSVVKEKDGNYVAYPSSVRDKELLLPLLLLGKLSVVKTDVFLPESKFSSSF